MGFEVPTFYYAAVLDHGARSMTALLSRFTELIYYEQERFFDRGNIYSEYFLYLN